MTVHVGVPPSILKSCSETAEQTAVPLAKQDPQGKAQKSSHKVFFSYADVHESTLALAPRIKDELNPDVIVAIGGGGFIPARMLRTALKVPILAVSLELYENFVSGDEMAQGHQANEVRKIQWFDPQSQIGKKVHGGRVLVVDEVDDSRLTLEYCLRLLQNDETCVPAKVGVAVVHNKKKPKKGVLGEDVLYFAGADVDDNWNCYPWDAGAYGHTIKEHEQLAQQKTGSGGVPDVAAGGA